MSSALRLATRYGAHRMRCSAVLAQTSFRPPFALDPPQQRSFAVHKNKGLGKGATAGLIAVQQPGLKKKKKGGPRICSGCGTQVISGDSGGSLFSTGEDAIKNTSLSKKQAKKARYADLGEFGNNFLCNRCKALQKNNIWEAYDAIQDVDSEIFVKQLGHIVSRRRFGMCLIVADATDPEHSAPKNVRRSIGKVPCVLVLTKCDLLPRMQKRDMRNIKQCIQKITGMNFFGTFAVSAHTGSGILEFSEFLLKNIRGRDVFCVGSANVGKSTLVQRLAATIAPNIYMRGSSYKANKRKKTLQDIPVTASNLPGTTLQAVRIPCFPSDRHALWDTPGIIQSKAVQYSVFPPHLMEPLTRAMPIPLKERFLVRKGFSVLIEAAWMDPDPTDNDVEAKTESHPDEVERELLPPISDTCVLARLDVVSTEEGNGVMVQPYLHQSLRVRIVPTAMAPTTATIPSHHIERVQALMRKKFPEDLVTSRPLSLFISESNPDGIQPSSDKETDEMTGRVYMDLVFASLGWLSISNFSAFGVKPWCVEGSRFSKRKSLYPTNLSQVDIENQRSEWEADIENLESHEAKRLLDQSAREGRRISGMPIVDSPQTSGDYDEFMSVDDEWYM